MSTHAQAIDRTDAAPANASIALASADELFERRIRPVLVANCYRCHAQGAKNKGGLDLTIREGLIKGGSRGPAVVPGDPDSSLLVKAIRRLPDAAVKMPPGKALPEAAVNDFAAWIADGAAWPETPKVALSDDALPGDWALQPIRDPPVPTVSDKAWPRHGLDLFVLARLEHAGLTPSAPIDKRGFIRRVTFDLIGLPPTAEEIETYLSDDSDEAELRLVNRLLASPHYGERWARHWLDVVRYAETDGHEFDVDKPNAYRYRDYVIEAFNRDLPFDQFVREQIAGDLIPLDELRTSSDGATRLAPIGTGFWYLGEVQNTPVDERQDRANQVENQLDVFGKAFLGLTLGCARCHDHKFDPIPTTDYYALAGFLYSSQKVQQCVDGVARQSELEKACADVIACDQQLVELTAAVDLDRRIAGAERLAPLLLAAREVLQAPSPNRSTRCQQIALQYSLDPRQLGAFAQLVDAAADAPNNYLWLWRHLVSVADSRIARQVAAIARDPSSAAPAPQVAPSALATKSPPTKFADFDGADFSGWVATGAAFGATPTPTNEGACTAASGPGMASTARVSGSLTGRLTSPRFTITRPFIWFRIGGANDIANCRISLVVNGQPLGLLTQTGRGDRHLERRFFDVHELLDREVFLEIVDESDAADASISVDDICFADEPPALSGKPAWLNLVSGSIPSKEMLAAAYQDLVVRELTAYRDSLARGEAKNPTEVLRWALRTDVPLVASADQDDLGNLPPETRERVVSLREHRAASLLKLGPSTIALVATDAQPRDVAVQQRGDASQTGHVVPRGFLSCVEALDHRPARLEGSGRLELADWVVSRLNPLTARVIVNRIWQYHFGSGLVPTPDNFGETGQRPTHPELLDYLACRFMESGWSIKSLQRMILSSAAYRQGNQQTPDALSRDPENRLLHRVPPRRLDAECLRDAMLAVAGNLDSRLYGPSVKLHLTPYMDGHDLPKSSGPLDGDGRRSIYLEVRRNHLTPLLATFGFPRPQNTAGHRNQAVLPAQALSLMNNPFVVHQAQVWGSRLATAPGSAADKVTHLFVVALGREPDEIERREALEFLDTRRADGGANGGDPSEAAWAALAHVVFTLPEFQFVR
ncbi:MAG: PSD1 and planctomycete cytochrome C domain-containing protein [Pirellulales bacterium]|nr:PSD1 and planctomycete cytochrome C domain-containing protein [Pirellulales bacterium]